MFDEPECACGNPQGGYCAECWQSVAAVGPFCHSCRHFEMSAAAGLVA